MYSYFNIVHIYYTNIQLQLNFKIIQKHDIISTLFHIKELFHMSDFFSGEMGNSLEWFGLSHILLMFGFVLTIIGLILISPKIKNSKYEYIYRIALIVLVVIFEWNVFENRILNGSIFRMPLCAVSLYGLTYAVLFKNEKVFKVVYFYIFGTFLSFLFFDTPWGLDRWGAWTFFGAHATIAWLAVYGYKVLDMKPTIKNFYQAIIVLAIYAFVSGYAFLKYGGSDELFLFHPAADFLQFLIDIHPAVYVVVYSSLAVLLMYITFLPVYLPNRKK